MTSWIKSHILGITITGLIIIIVVSLLSETSDTPPVLYATQDTTLQVTEGKVLFTREKPRMLKAPENVILQVGDSIKTLPSSKATIFWADGSVTRLSEKTSIKISSLTVSGDLSSVQIRFEIESGKTWSNVIRSLLPDSFFEQTYDKGNYVATVRGTVFEINLDKDYARAVHHGISIKNIKENTETDLPEWKAVHARNWKEIGKELLDNAWEKLNSDEDVKYLDGKMKKLSDTLYNYTQANTGVKSWTKKLGKLLRREDTIDSMLATSILDKNTDKIDALKKAVANANTPEKKAILHARLLAYHQATNILPENESTLALRDTLRDLIIETAPADKQDALKKTFTQVTFNDYVDALGNGSKTQADKLKVKLEKAVKDGVDIPALGNFTSQAKTILENKHLQWAIEWVQQEGGNIYNQVQTTVTDAASSDAVSSLKNDATSLWSDLKDAATK